MKNNIRSSNKAREAALRDIFEYTRKQQNLKNKNHRMNINLDVLRYSLENQLSIFSSCEIVELSKIKNT